MRFIKSYKIFESTQSDLQTLEKSGLKPKKILSDFIYTKWR